MFYVDATKCTGCGICIENCPQGAISLQNGKAYIDKRLCAECGSCLELCPNGAVCEVEMPARKRVSERLVKLDKRKRLPNRRQTGVVTALASVIPVAVDLISAFAWRRVGRGRGRGRGFYNRPGRGRSGRGRGCFWGRNK